MTQHSQNDFHALSVWSLVFIYFKITTNVLVPKKCNLACMKAYRLNLSHVTIKYFEWLVLQYIKHNPPPVLDPLQFVYRANCTTEDAISTVL